MSAPSPTRPVLSLDPVALVPSGEAVGLRPVRRSDEQALREMIERCSLDDLRLRCFGSCRGFAASFAGRLSRLGGDGAEFALAAVLPSGEIGGVVHAIGQPGGTEAADYDILVRTDLKGRGIGARLMRAMLREAGRHGFRAVGGDVLLGNSAMLLLAADLGFRRVGLDGGVVRIEAPADGGAGLVATRSAC